MTDAFTRPPGLAFFLLCAVLFVLQIAPRLTGDALVMDEEWDLANSIYYWKDLNAGIENGPLPLTGSLLGLPALGFPLYTDPLPPDSDPEVRAYFFFYYLNSSRRDLIVAACRTLSVFFGLALGYLIYRLAAPRGTLFLSVAMLLWAFDPMILGYSGVAKNDILAAFFSLAAWMVHARSRHINGMRWMFLTGLATGMAVLTKMTAFFLLPCLLALELKDAWALPSRERFLFLYRRLGAFIVGMTVWIVLAYLPTTMAVTPDVSPLKAFARYFLWSAPHGLREVPPYFLGRDRWELAFLGFPISVLLKWTLPFTLLIVIGVFLASTRRLSWPDGWTFPVAAMLLLILPNMSSKLCRHLLPVYPFLILMAASTAQWLWSWAKERRHPAARWAVACLIWAWPPWTALANFPHDLSYMNDLVARDRKGYYLSGFNWDFNQDTKRLAAFARKRGWGTVKLANSARVDPHFYGLSWEPWTQRDLQAPQPGTVYVLNGSIRGASDQFLQDFSPVKRSWVFSTPPTGWVADTWMYYEVPGTPDQQESPRVNSFPYYRYDLIPYRLTKEDAGKDVHLIVLPHQK